MQSTLLALQSHPGCQCIMGNRRLDDIDRELIRRAPDGLGVAIRLADLFGLSLSGVNRISSGSRGLPCRNGLGSRPEQLKTRELVERWHARQLAQTESQYRRALEAIEANEALPDPHIPYLDQVAAGLFDGVGKGRPRSIKPPAVVEHSSLEGKDGLLRETLAGWLGRTRHRRA